MTSNGIDDLAPVIKRAAKSVAFQWPGVVDADDVEQSIHIRLLESEGSVEAILGMGDRARYRAIVGIGHQLASGERADYDYYKGSYRYSVAEVRGLLEMGLLADPPANFKAELMDAEDAVKKLSDRYLNAIFDRYVVGDRPGSEADQKALERAVDALTDAMNQVQKRRHSERDDGLGTRQILTSAQALELSGSEWDGEDDE